MADGLVTDDVYVIMRSGQLISGHLVKERRV